MSLLILNPGLSLSKITQEAPLPTWGQIEKLSLEAEKMVHRRRLPETPDNLFLAMVTLLTMAVSTQAIDSHHYWTYIPNPPPLRPVTLEDSPVPLFVNDSAWLPGPYDQNLPTKKEEEGCQLVNYTVGSDATAICIGFGSICLKTGYQKWLSVIKESNDSKTSFFLLTALTFLEKEETSSMMNPPDLHDCIAEISHGIENWIQWKLYWRRTIKRQLSQQQQLAFLTISHHVENQKGGDVGDRKNRRKADPGHMSYCLSPCTFLPSRLRV